MIRIYSTGIWKRINLFKPNLCKRIIKQNYQPLEAGEITYLNIMSQKHAKNMMIDEEELLRHQQIITNKLEQIDSTLLNEKEENKWLCKMANKLANKN